MKNKHGKHDPTEDRRTLKTKKFLAEALKELILEKEYDEITIQEITDRANVGRSTFYAHYESKEQLLVGNINFQETLIDTPDDAKGYPLGINVSYLFSHNKEHLMLYKAMSGNRSIDILGNYFIELCTSKIIENLKRQFQYSKKGQQILRYKAEAAAGGIIRMMFKWLEDGATVPSEEMVAYANQILNDFILEEK